jgi:hypothetical protein
MTAIDAKPQVPLGLGQQPVKFPFTSVNALSRGFNQFMRKRVPSLVVSDGFEQCFAYRLIARSIVNVGESLVFLI